MTKTQRSGWRLFGRRESEPVSLLSTRQAAEILGLSPRGVTRRVAEGVIIPQWKNDGLRGGYVFDERYIRSLAAEQRRLRAERDEREERAS